MANVIAETATMNEVRIDPRLPATAVPSIRTVKLSPGETVTLINISATGVLVEGPTRFVPRTRVSVTFEGGFVPTQVRGKVVRCQVASIASGRLCYQSGIAFDTRITLPEAAAASEPAGAAVRSEREEPATPSTLSNDVRNRW